MTCLAVPARPRRAGERVSAALLRLAAAALLMGAAPALGSGPQLLAPADGEAVGWSSALAERYAVVGGAGSAYVFAWDGARWSELRRLSPAEGLSAYGNAVGVHGDLAFVQALGIGPDGSYVGAVAVYDLAGGDEPIDVLWNEPPYESDAFGSAIVMAGDHLFVGARHDRVGDVRSGSVSVFAFDPAAGFSRVAKLAPAGTSDWDDFGYAVAAHGDLLVVGAQGRGETGAAFVYRLVGGEWTLEAELAPDPEQAPGGFGSAVAVEDGIVLVGAEADSGAARAAGAVYAFAAGADGWRQTHRIAPDDPDELGLFGASVALRLPFLVVGAYADDELALGAGAAYLFELVDGEWRQVTKLLSPDVGIESAFGASVGISESHVLVTQLSPTLAAVYER